MATNEMANHSLLKITASCFSLCQKIAGKEKLKNADLRKQRRISYTKNYVFASTDDKKAEIYIYIYIYIGIFCTSMYICNTMKMQRI